MIPVPDRMADHTFRPNRKDSVRETLLMQRACGEDVPPDEFPIPAEAVELMLDAVTFCSGYRFSLPPAGNVTDQQAAQLVMCVCVACAFEVAFPAHPCVIVYGTIRHVFETIEPQPDPEDPEREVRSCQNQVMMPWVASLGMPASCRCGNCPAVLDPWGMMWREKFPDAGIPMIMVAGLRYSRRHVGSVYSGDSYQTALWSRFAEANGLWAIGREFIRVRGPAYRRWAEEDE